MRSVLVSKKIQHLTYLNIYFKQIFILVIIHNCNGFINEDNNSTNTLQVNVSAGYGVRSENTTIVTPSPNYQFSERKIQNENITIVQVSHDQMSQPSQQISEALPTPSYQVREKSNEVQDKTFEVPKPHRHRTIVKRYRQKRPEEPKNLNDLEHKEPARNIHNHKQIAAGTKIVEVLRVPAMYELHLQSDPQRLAALNTALLTKLMNNNNQYKKPVMPQFYQYGGTKNFIPQQSSTVNYIQTYGGSPIPPQRLQNLKTRYTSQKLNGVTSQNSNFIGFSQTKTPLQTSQTQNIGFKQNLLRPQTYPTSYQNIQTNLPPTESSKKFSPSIPTQSSINYPPLSNEIPADFYQKPQALHEVPAPVLNKQPHKYMSKITVKSTSVPNLVYGKPVDPPYQPSTQAPGLWSSNIQDLTGSQNSYSQNTYQYGKEQVDPIPNYYQQPQLMQQPLQQIQQPLQQFNQKGVGENGGVQYNPHNEDYYNHPHYQGPQNVQHYYNSAIGDHLDQTLVNVNGGVATYLNSDGTMTVSNFHHSPKLYNDIPTSENQNMDEVPSDYGLMSYQTQQNNLAEFNNQLYSGYNHEIPVTENQIETGENQVNDQNSDLNNLLVGAASANLDEAQNQMTGHGRHLSKRIMYGRSGGSNRRMAQPMDYILYIKERILD